MKTLKKYFATATMAAMLMGAMAVTAPPAQAATIYVNDIHWYGESQCSTFDNICGHQVGSAPSHEECNSQPMSYLFVEFNAIMNWMIGFMGFHITWSCQ